MGSAGVWGAPHEHQRWLGGLPQPPEANFGSNAPLRIEHSLVDQ